MKRRSRLLHFLSSGIVVVALFCIFDTCDAASKAKFPLRAKYPQLKTVDTLTLLAIYNQSVIVDSRSRMEYNVVHMEGAKSLLVDRMSEEDLLDLRPKKDSRPLVFYSNNSAGAECYKAAAKAVRWGFGDVLVYDAGLFTWARQQPQRTLFFAEKLNAESVKTAFISKEKYNSVLLTPANFIAKANSGNFTVIDGRFVEKIEKKPIQLNNLQIMSVELMTFLLHKNSWNMPTSGLLVMDHDGSMVQWLQYYFERNGISNYYFLKGGVRQWYADGYDKNGKKK